MMNFNLKTLYALYQRLSPHRRASEAIERRLDQQHRILMTAISRVEQRLQPLARLDEVERRILQRQDELFLKQEALAPEVIALLNPSQVRVEAQLGKADERLTQLNAALGDAVNGWAVARKDFANDVRLHDRQLRTMLSLQEHLMAARLTPQGDRTIADGGGAKEIPQIRQILSDWNTEGRGNLVSDPYVEFLNQKVYFDDLISLYVVFKEIFLYEDYFADLGTETPYIIDAGAHIGLATIYFMDLHQGASVVCFEPDPRNFELLERNTAHFGSSVKRVKKAITADGNEVQLLRRRGMSMASSIYARSSQISNQDNVVADATKLSPFLERQVDLLKMDIEGPEASVLTECRDLLHNVHFLFIEFHTGDGLPLSRLRQILELLDTAGFTYQIERAREYQTRMMHRPFTHLDVPCTHVLHARNQTWPPAGAVIARDRPSGAG